eukprot:scaffold193950_cov46-Attheya_sp.AAC.2
MSRQSAYVGHGQNALYMDSCQGHGIDAYGFPARVVPPLPPPRGLVYKNVPWESCSIPLPVVLPVSTDEKLRHRCIMKSIKSIKEMSGKWESKLRLLSSCFDSSIAAWLGKAEVQRSMDNLLSPAWSFDLPVVRGLDGAIVNITDPPTDLERTTARYMEMQLQHNPGATIHVTV